jgi:signal transduction histidine kinase
MAEAEATVPAPAETPGAGRGNDPWQRGPLGRLVAGVGGGRSSLGAHIALFQGIIVAALVASGGATLFAIERLDYYIDRDRYAGRQLDTMVRLSAHMNRYSENIAELLLLGRNNMDDFSEARTGVDEGLIELQRLTEREISFVRDPAEAEAEQVEQARIAQMRSLFERIDHAVQRLLLLREDGRIDEAVALFRTSIEEGLDAELERIIAEALADEEAELRQIEARTNELEGRLTYLVAMVSGAAVIVAGLAGLSLARSLGRPLARVAEATRAIGDGDLSVRLAEDLPGELAELARQFNRSATRLAAEKARLLQVQAGLEAEVAGRTAELEDANGRLQRLDQMRMLFLADISHELRTPLTVLRGEAEVALRAGQSTGMEREALARIADISRQMGRLVEDLLFLARAEVGAVRFEIEPLDLGAVVEAVLPEARVLARDRGIAIEALVGTGPFGIAADAGRLGQALLIVLDNAVKYADAGTRIDLTLGRDGRDAVIEVANLGPTIAAGDLPYIFSRFHRGRNQATIGTEGSGLGLSIAKWILDTHRGSIALTSASGRTVVTMRLPLHS